MGYQEIKAQYQSEADALEADRKLRALRVTDIAIEGSQKQDDRNDGFPGFTDLPQGYNLASLGSLSMLSNPIASFAGGMYAYGPMAGLPVQQEGEADQDSGVVLHATVTSEMYEKAVRLVEQTGGRLM